MFTNWGLSILIFFNLLIFRVSKEFGNLIQNTFFLTLAHAGLEADSELKEQSLHSKYA